MSTNQILGEKRFYNLQEEANRVRAHGIMEDYDADEWLAAIGTNVSLKTTRAALFSNVTIAHRVLIRADFDVTVRFNSTSEPAFTINGGVPFEETRLEITDIFLTNPTTNNPIKVYMT